MLQQFLDANLSPYCEEGLSRLQKSNHCSCYIVNIILKNYIYCLVCDLNDIQRVFDQGLRCESAVSRFTERERRRRVAMHT
jgi:hypothetical protein